jgi:ABC-type uncharacterized transport system substrate-binding protein
MQLDQIKRRDFITLLGGAAAAWPLAARSQQSAMPVIGFLRSTSPAPFAHLVAAFNKGLNEAGYVGGRNVAIEQRWAEDRHDRLPALVADLIHRQVAVIVANNIAALAAKAATTTVPIVFATGSDPVTDGLVASFNRPGGNVTGVSFISGALGAKRLELLRQLAPKAATIAMLVNRGTLETVAEREDVHAAAQSIGQQVIILDVSTERDIEPAFATFVERGAGALLAGTGAFFNSNRKLIVALAARHALPAIYPLREAVVDGGLMSYGSSMPDPIVRLASMPRGFSRGRSLRTCQSCSPPNSSLCSTSRPLALGLDIPLIMQMTADEVIE